MSRDFVIAKNLALRLLNRYDKTQKEMKKYLIDKCVESKIADDVIRYLVEYNFINDERYAKNYINKHLHKYGEKKIFFDLILKGLEEDFLKKEFSKISNEEKIEIGIVICEKKYNSIKHKFEGFKIKHKLFCHLVVKGYDYDLASKIIDRVLMPSDISLKGD